MDTWVYYEFVNSVSFPGMGPCMRVYVEKFKRTEHNEVGVRFVCDDDRVLLVPWANVRWAGGCIAPQVEKDTSRKTAKKL